ncbi:hypothetical protein Gorai_002664 [Gossypium raimondii]|uniref:Reverse transcriptase domain-containing protein n=1 Tax=Gossypium raimondii TaxID=29730 RepID=A0A7J8QLM5_GOSRA|nr:hypothetical protein [Gossypium raimondii]
MVVKLNNAVLDTRKHSAVTFKEINDQNRGSLGGGEGHTDGLCECSRTFQEYNKEYKPDIVSLLETRVSGDKFDRVISKLGFQHSHRVEAISFFGGIWRFICRIWALRVPLLPGTGGIFERLDRVIGNFSWGNGFPHYSVTHLPRLKSNHGPLLLSLRPNVNMPRGHSFRLDHSDVLFWGKKVSKEEIKVALFDMTHLKAPESDGFHALFIKINGTWLVVPFVSNFESYTQFRPISLCSILYKLVMKVIANQFKVVFPKIITSEQAGFIASKNITDNIIVAQELGHCIKSSISSRKRCLIRLSRSGLTFSHLFFTGHRINASKTNVVFSNGLDEKYRRKLESIRCWKDNWILIIGPLVNHIRSRANLDLDRPLKELVINDRSWNMDMFRVWLSNDTTKDIVNIPPPQPLTGPDKIS